MVRIFTLRVHIHSFELLWQIYLHQEYPNLYLINLGLLYAVQGVFLGEEFLCY